MRKSIGMQFVDIIGAIDRFAFTNCVHTIEIDTLQTFPLNTFGASIWGEYTRSQQNRGKNRLASWKGLLKFDLGL